MKKVIHIQTVVQTIMGILDDDGNVIEKKPLQMEVPKFERMEFAYAFDKLLDARNEISSAIANEES